MAWNRDHCEQEALRLHQHAIGKELTVSRVDCFIAGKTTTYQPAAPIRVRVKETPDEMVIHWEDEYLDPKWEVEPVEPVADLVDACSHWIYPPSIRVGHGPEE